MKNYTNQGVTISRYLIFVLISFISCKTQKEIESEQEHRPNILFAIADDQSFPYASAYGTSGIKTPSFDKVAKDGVLFTNAFVAAPQCSPSRAAILTGKNIWQIEEAGTHGSYFPKKHPVFTDLLAGVGYKTGFTGKPWGPGNWKDAGWLQNPVGQEFNEKMMSSVPANGMALKDYYGNFVDFFRQKEKGQPFFFWYGGHEPHRAYEEGSGVKAGKILEESAVPAFLPDHELIRSDVADYVLEIEWFDAHLGKMIQFLEEQGELENTIIVVTADNGMPFPSAKANLQEYGTHVPLAICWPSKMKGNRVVEDLVALIDMAPTFLELAKVVKVPEMTGKSLSKLLIPVPDVQPKKHREFVLTGRERHTHARPDNLGYPARAIRTQDYLYVRNFKPHLWPAGDPVPFTQKTQATTQGFKPLWPGFHDVDDSPSKLFLMEQQSEYPRHYNLAYDKRPSEQLYDIRKDPGCVNNVAQEPEYEEIRMDLKTKLEIELKRQGDPRVLGYGNIFDSYPRMSIMRQFDGFNERGEYNLDYIQEGQVKIE
ncbi:Ulvan-active sulfatase [Arenibacter antarcticus]|uniref:Sulfatase n=1 Tax=Arenibacter antarcticus TaxID=2040469 RepID=A0ABW5VGE3_9FLAO|nr:sulfatase [Arenibacter sp. H213]MCM4167133.1 heparan N-sulfatase [Arenibacter sp. H213]